MNRVVAQFGDVFVGRQPIFGPNLKTVGYELLYRNCDVDFSSFPDEGKATAHVLLNTYLDIGLEHVVGSHLAFLNIPKEFILEKFCEKLPKNRVVLNIPRNVEPHPRVLETLTSLSQQGYTIALDDYIYHERLQPYLELADIVKIDVSRKNQEHIQHEAHRLRDFRVRLFADNVKTREVYDICNQAGYFYFQGCFYYHSASEPDCELPGNRVALLELLGNIQDPSISLKRLVEFIRNDLSLSCKILRYVNSAFVGLPKRVNSIEQAAYMVGIDRIRTWATLILMATGKDQPTELLVMALVRAKMCELVGYQKGAGSPEKYFTLGILSILDSLYECSIEDITDKLPLSEDILDALTSETGHMGEVLNGVKAYEKGEWLKLKRLQLHPGTIRDSYLEAIDWANHFSPIIDQPE